MRRVTEVTIDEARAVPDGDPLARWAATVEALHAKCDALRKRVGDVEHDLGEVRDAINSVTREFDDLAALHARNARTLEHAHDRALASGASNAYEHASYLFRKRAEVTK